MQLWLRFLCLLFFAYAAEFAKRASFCAIVALLF